MNKFILFIALFLFSSVPAFGFYRQTGDVVELSATSTYIESVAVAGEQITINSDIDGDLFCLGSTVTINSHVTGNIYCAGANINLNGRVDGDIITAGQTIKSNSVATQNQIAAGQDLIFSDTSIVGGDLFAFGQNLNLNNTIGRDLVAFASSLNLNNYVSGNSLIGASEYKFSSTALLDGDLEYYHSSQSTINIPENSVSGQITPHVITVEEPKKSPSPVGGFILYHFLSTLLLGTAFIYFQPKLFQHLSQNITQHPIKSFFVGLVSFVVAPISVIILFITIIGFPLGVFVMLTYLLILGAAYILASYQVGRLALLTIKIPANSFFTLMCGLLVMIILGLIPVIGWLVDLVATCIGAGTSLLQLNHHHDQNSQ